jgi:hypothetical protein
VDDIKVMHVTPSKLSVLTPGEDENVEQQLTQSEKLQQIVSEEEERKKTLSPMNKCQAEFAALSKAICAEAKVFCMTYGNDTTECFNQSIILIPILHHPLLLML